jgi:hypothetical protein
MREATVVRAMRDLRCCRADADLPVCPQVCEQSPAIANRRRSNRLSLWQAGDRRATELVQAVIASEALLAMTGAARYSMKDCFSPLLTPNGQAAFGQSLPFRTLSNPTILKGRTSR